jgi:DNA-binding beta-propeller fold protein YncE
MTIRNHRLLLFALVFAHVVAGCGGGGDPKERPAAESGRIVTVDLLESGSRLIHAIGVDADGTVYLGSNGLYAVPRKGRKGDARSVIGLERFGGAGAQGLTMGDKSTVFVSNTGGHVIWAVKADGSYGPVAGNGTDGASGDGGAATDGGFDHPTILDFDERSGDLLIADLSQVRRVNRQGIISSVIDLAPLGPPPNSFTQVIQGLAVDPDSGAVYVADGRTDQIRRVDRSGEVTLVAGNGERGVSSGEGDGGAATEARFAGISSLAFDPRTDVLYVAEALRVRRIDRDGVVTTIAGGGSRPPGDEPERPTDVLLRPETMTIDPSGNLYIIDNVKSDLFLRVVGTGENEKR